MRLNLGELQLIQQLGQVRLYRQGDALDHAALQRLLPIACLPCHHHVTILR